MAFFIWRRETDLALLTFLGGRVFPGKHRAAKFYVAQDATSLEMEVQTVRREADVNFRAQFAATWDPSPAFGSLGEASKFFECGDCGFSCSMQEGKIEGMQLRALRWEAKPLGIEHVHSAFFSNQKQFPDGSVIFDSAMVMRGIPHEWHELKDVPELAGKA